MKQIILLLILLVLHTSCGKGSKQMDSTSIENTEVSEIKQSRSMNQEALKNFLLKTIPFTEAEFKDAFPKSIKSLPLDREVDIINQQGYAVYGNDKITLTVYDCAGKNNGMATMFETVYKIKAQDNENTQYSNHKRDAIKTTNTYRINTNQSDIVFLHNNRWYVALKGSNMSPDELWNVFDLNALKNFK